MPRSIILAAGGVGGVGPADGCGPHDGGSLMARTKPPEARRADLMDAAEVLFVAKGISATSIDDIVAGAHVAKGTFYLYFASKDALLAALQERFVEGFLARLEQAMGRYRADNWKARLRVWVKTTLDTYFDQVALHDVLFHDFHPKNRREMANNIVVRQLASMLQSGAQAGVWTVGDPHRVAVMLFNAMHGLADYEISAGGKPDRGRLAKILNDFCERALQRCDGS